MTYDLLKAYYKDEDDDLLKAYYKDEDDDLQWAQQQLDLIDTVGYQNWLTQQL